MARGKHKHDGRGWLIRMDPESSEAPGIGVPTVTPSEGNGVTYVVTNAAGGA